MPMMSFSPESDNTVDATAQTTDPLIPDHPSYLIAANAHQQAGNNSSIFDPTTWADRVDNGTKFTVSMLTRAVSSTYNAGITVGKLVGIADDSDKVKTQDWLSAMDDDLGKYYKANESSVNTVGDLVGMLVPGTAGVKVFNLAQKGIALAAEGRAGLNLAYSFGTLPTKADAFARLAQAEIASTTNPFSYINANLAKSLATNYAQSYLEVAAFQVAAETTMRDSPLFSDHDMGDIVHGALTAGGFIGVGLLGAIATARTVHAIKLAGKEVDTATHGYRTVDQETITGTPASERAAFAISNRSKLLDVEEGADFTAQKTKAVLNTEQQILNEGRTAVHELTKGDTGLGNHVFEFLTTRESNDVAAKLAGVTAISRAGTSADKDIEVLIASAEAKLAKHAASVSSAEAKLGEALVGTTEHSTATTKLADVMQKRADALTELDKLRELPVTNDYMKLVGEDSGVIYAVPPTLRIADKVDNAAEAAKVVKSFKHSQADTSFDVVNALSVPNARGVVIGEDGVEARNITAQYGDFDINSPVGRRDLPYLERGYKELLAEGSGKLALTDGSELTSSELYHYIVGVKIEVANRLTTAAELAGTAPPSQATLAKLINTSEDFVTGSHRVNNPAEDLFRSQSDAIDFTKGQIAQGLWTDAKGTIPIWDRPSLMRTTRNTEQAKYITGHEIDGITALKQQQVLYREVADNVVNTFGGEWASKYVDRIPAAILATANRGGVGRGLVAGMNGDYMTLASYTQQMGVVTNAWITDVVKNLSDTFTPSVSKLLNDTDAGTEFWKVCHQLRKTPEQYTLVEKYSGKAAGASGDGMHLVNRKQLEWEQGGQDPGNLPVFEDASAPVAIPLTTEGMQDWATAWDTSRRAEQVHRANLRASQAIPMAEHLKTNFFIPGVDAKRFPFYAYVVDDSVTSTGHISMIHANTAADLEALASKVPTEQGLRVVYDKQSADWHKAMQQYDYSLGINENYIDSALQRTGAAAPFQPVTEPEVLWGELNRWRSNQATGLIREMVEHKFSPEFAELRRQGQLYDLANTSRKGFISDKFNTGTVNPYNDYIAAALYTNTSEGAPIWNAINRLAETSISTAASKLQDTWKTVITPEDLEQVNTHLESIGAKSFTDAATYALANHTAPKPVLSKFVRDMNGILTTLMLRVDPMNAVNNALGHSVLYFAEMRKLAQTLGMDGAIAVPGTDATILSPAKMAASAYGKWWDNIIGGKDGGRLEAECNSLGIMPTITQEFKQIAASGTVDGSEQAADLMLKRDTAFGAMKSVLAKTGSAFGDIGERVSGNHTAQEMNRFVTGVTAMEACDAAIAAGKLDPALKASIVNTFVNRVEGITLAKQRPLLFTGPVGQAVGLFQTYQFNMLQQLFRHVAEGDTKTTAMLLGMQGSIYGMNGLPAFNAMNQYIVGNASGNINHMDSITATYGVAGKEVGDWLLYGVASNMLIHPDLKVNLYSRGDINPRQVTVVPTNIADVPIVGATTKFFGSMYGAMKQMNDGANVWNSFLQGVQHSTISRPLTGIAQVLEGSTSTKGKVMTTDNNNNIIMENDLFSAMSAARILGAKPLDEAVALDAYHRVQTYNAASLAQTETLGAGIKATVAGGDVPSKEQMDGFTSEYMKAGGKLANFNRFYTRQVLDANKSKVNLMIDNSNKAGSQYMKTVMGGYSLTDYVNNASEGGGKFDITGGQ